MIPVCEYDRIYLNPQNYNFHCGLLLGDSHDKHILIIFVIDSWNFIKLQEWFSEFEWDDNSKQNKKSNSLLIKMLNFSRMSILKPQNSVSWKTKSPQNQWKITLQTRLSNDWILWTNNPFWKDNCLAVVARGYNKDINFTILSGTEFILLNAFIF